MVGIQSTKTTAIRPLEPIERDFMSIYDLMYDGLMVINDDYLPEYALAESYTHSGKNWTFKLRENLFFSDGSPVTANDVVATTNWILAKATNEESTDKGYYMNLRYFIDSVSARDDRTVVFKASRNYYGLLYAMTYPILPAWALEMDNPPGTGAYMAESFVPGNTLQLITNPHWWQTPPQVTSILFVMHQLPADVIEAYEYARVDAAFTRQIAGPVQVRYRLPGAGLPHQSAGMPADESQRLPDQLAERPRSHPLSDQCGLHRPADLQRHGGAHQYALCGRLLDVQ